jgi:hypothetical protein
MKGIDLELRVRAALYTRLSPGQLQAMCAGHEVFLIAKHTTTFPPKDSRKILPLAEKWPGL